jgi:hypothetical protein
MRAPIASLLILCSAIAVSAQQRPLLDATGEPHTALRRFIGEWEAQGRMWRSADSSIPPLEGRVTLSAEPGLADGPITGRAFVIFSRDNGASERQSAGPRPPGHRHLAHPARWRPSPPGLRLEHLGLGGIHHRRVPLPGAPGPGGKFLLALRRGPDGRWLIAADMDNSAAPQPR